MTTLSPDVVSKVLEADGASFTTLVKIAKLDPAKDFRKCNLEGIDFAGCNLSGFDFSGSILLTCTFGGALLGDARFAGAKTDPGALEQALDWEAYQARPGARAKYQPSEESDSAEGIGATVRKLRSIVGIQGHLRYLADKGTYEAIPMIAAAASNAPIQEAIEGLAAATGRKIEMSAESGWDGHQAITELRSVFHHHRALIEELRYAAERAPTFALSFACISALTWLYQGLGTSQLDRAKALLAIEGKQKLVEQDWLSLHTIVPNKEMFDWQYRAIRKALQVDKRRPTEVHIIQLIYLAKTNDQLLRVFRMMVEREMTISDSLAIALARKTLEAHVRVRAPALAMAAPVRQAEPEDVVLSRSVWGLSEGGRVLLKVLGTKAEKVHLRLTDSYQVWLSLRHLVR